MATNWRGVGHVRFWLLRQLVASCSVNFLDHIFFLAIWNHNQFFFYTTNKIQEILIMLQCKIEQYCISTKIGWICWEMHWHVSNKILLCRHKTLLTSISQVIMLYYLPLILRAVSGFDIYSLLPTCNMFEIVGVLLCLTKCHVIIKFFFYISTKSIMT